MKGVLTMYVLRQYLIGGGMYPAYLQGISESEAVKTFSYEVKQNKKNKLYKKIDLVKTIGNNLTVIRTTEKCPDIELSRQMGKLFLPH
jgi:hypothetical protein